MSAPESKQPDAFASNALIATTPAPAAAKRRALAVCIASFVAFCAVIPFARVSLPRIEAFVPISESIFALNCVMTAGILIVGFSRSRLRVLLVLAGGYLFTALASVAYLVTFPGLFTNSGLLAASPQTNAWVNALRQGGAPSVVIFYPMLTRDEVSP